MNESNNTAAKEVFAMQTLFFVSFSKLFTSGSLEGLTVDCDYRMPSLEAAQRDLQRWQERGSVVTDSYTIDISSVTIETRRG